MISNPGSPARCGGWPATTRNWQARPRLGWPAAAAAGRPDRAAGGW